MAKSAAKEYRAKLTDDSGVIRGKIPSPLVREMGGRPGDFVVYRRDDGGKINVSISRGARGGGGKKAAKGGGKKGRK